MTSIIEERDNVIMTIDGEPESYGPLIEAIATDCAANRKEIAAANKRLDNTNVVLSNLSFEVGGQRQQLAIMGNDVTDTKDVVEAMNLRVIKIDAETSETNKRLARLEIDTGRRLSRLETAQQDANARLNDMDARLNDMDARLNDVKATQIVHGDRLSAILDAVQRPDGQPGTKTAEN